jgi:phytoene/squalene synthetase
MAFEAKRAQSLYAAARRALAPEDRSTLLTAEAMRLIYAALLEQIVKSNYRVLDRRHSLSAPHKLYLVGRAWAAGRIGTLLG